MFNLGKHLDPTTRAQTGEPMQYDPDDLTTHAVVVGMTGSGKTGLCLDLLEEAALAGIPAILIDPKGDIINLLLQFPELRPADFEPWVNVDDARRAKLSVTEFATQKAEEWKAGLAEWGLGSADVQRLKEGVDWAIYTPGSDAGRPVSILHSLESPGLPWSENQEILRERISGLCSALLGLIGVEADPVKSREHILLANLFEHAWKNAHPFDLATLIAQVQKPPFPKLGVFPVDSYYPEKDRMALAMALNAIVAAPSFQSWISGEPLDIPALLRTPEGKPRCSIFYVAHLNDAERMFFIALLLEQVGSWLRTQTGTTSLRGLLYFDEVYGYFPPYPQNPPTKAPLMRLLKQARAFGLGVVLVTQNPGDLDYKGLTNTGSWFIGKLQTERDKARLLEGLEAIASQARAALNVEELDTLISSLAPRTFLLHNVHAAAPAVFQTRWAMSYLAGPLTREQIRLLAPPPPATTATLTKRIQSPTANLQSHGLAQSPVSSLQAHGAAQAPAIPASIPQYYLSTTRSFEDALAAWRTQSTRRHVVEQETLDVVHHPALIAQAVVRYIVPKADINSDRRLAFVLLNPTVDSAPHWAEAQARGFEAAALSRTPPTRLNRAPDVPAPFTDPKRLAAWQKDLTTYLYRTADFTLHQNPTLKLFARPGQSYQEFLGACQRAADLRRNEEIDKLRLRYDKKLDTLETKLTTKQRGKDKTEDELRAREAESRWTGIENMIGVVMGRTPMRALSTSEQKKRLAQKAKNDLQETEDTIAELQLQIRDIKAEAEQAFQTIVNKWHAAAHEIQELRVTPKRSDILLEVFGIGWLPYWVVQVDGQRLELAGFEL